MSLDPLAEVPNLRDLAIHGLPPNLAPLAGCPGLERLSLLHAPGVRDLSGLSALGTLPLRDLELSAWPDLADLTAVEQWAGSLRHLTVSQCSASVDLTALAALEKLETVRLFYRGSVDLSPLRDLRRLQRLEVAPGGPVDLTPLAGKRGLEIEVGPAREVRGEQALGEGSRVVKRS